MRTQRKSGRTPRRRSSQKDSSGDAPTLNTPTAGDFDLNVETVLDGWESSHAIRELIANALDEAALSGTTRPEITHLEPGHWRIRDFGRGLRYVHLTQNECPEKLQNEGRVIGRFGVGLKDALAVLDRRKVHIRIRSAHNDITLIHRPKAGFSDVTTLHAHVTRPTDPHMRGTEAIVSDVADKDIEAAKGYFLLFSNEEVLEQIRYGQILRRSGSRPGRIYVNGLAVAEEPKFAFSYNVTVLTKAMRKALNRERTNVGRTAYGDRVKAMLLAAESESVAEELVKDVIGLADDASHEEVKIWTEVAVHACQILNGRQRVVFVTKEQLLNEKDMVDRAREDGREVIQIPPSIATKLYAVTDLDGKPIQSLRQFAAEWSASLEYKFVDQNELTDRERRVYGLWHLIAEAAGGLPPAFRELKISETMRPSVHEGMNPAGVWEAATGRVIIHRPQLSSPETFAGTLLHELTHARSGFTDVTREFEGALTDILGRLAAARVQVSPP